MKPQVAFFERHGVGRATPRSSACSREARDAGLLVIADAKRGDIGTTVDAYGEAWLRPGSPPRGRRDDDQRLPGPRLARAGHGRPPRRRARALFVLAATSNPEAAAIQRAVLQQSSRAGSTVAQAITQGVIGWNQGRADAATRALGSIGVVFGATIDLRLAGIDIDADVPRPGLPVLAPGFGHQGARARRHPPRFGAFAGGVIASESRALLAGGTRWDRRRHRASGRRVWSRDCLRRRPRPDRRLLAARGRPGRRIARGRRGPPRPRRREGRRRERRTEPARRAARGVRVARGRRGAPARARVPHLRSPRSARRRPRRIMEELGIAASKRLGGLGRLQRRRLREFLADWVAGHGGIGDRLVVLAGPTAVGKGTVAALHPRAPSRRAAVASRRRRARRAPARSTASTTTSSTTPSSTA